MFSFKSIYFLIFLLNLDDVNGKISDKRQCIDMKCSEPISKALTLLSYNSIEDEILSFKANVEVTVFSYGAGERPDLWGIELNGKRGYISKDMLKETKVMKKPTLLVDTHVPLEQKEQVIPQKVLQPYDVFEGTTIYQDSGIAPSSTETPTLPTVKPYVSIVKHKVAENLKPVESIPYSKSESKVNEDEATVEAEEDSDKEEDSTNDYEYADDDDVGDDDYEGEHEEETIPVKQEMDNDKKVNAFDHPITNSKVVETEISVQTSVPSSEVNLDTPAVAPPANTEVKLDTPAVVPPADRELKFDTPAVAPPTNSKEGSIEPAIPSIKGEIPPPTVHMEPSTPLLNSTKVEVDKNAKKEVASESVLASVDKDIESLKSANPEDVKKEEVHVVLISDDTVEPDTVNATDQIATKVPSSGNNIEEIVNEVDNKTNSLELKEEISQENKHLNVKLNNEPEENLPESGNSNKDLNNSKAGNEQIFITKGASGIKYPSSSPGVILENPRPSDDSSMEHLKQEVGTNQINSADNKEDINSEYTTGIGIAQLNQEAETHVINSTDNVGYTNSEYASKYANENMGTVKENDNVNSNEAIQVNVENNEAHILNSIVENEKRHDNIDAGSGSIIDNLLSFFTQKGNSEVEESTGNEEKKLYTSAISENVENTEVPIPNSIETKPYTQEGSKSEELLEMPTSDQIDQEVQLNSQEIGVSSENNNQDGHCSSPGAMCTSSADILSEHKVDFEYSDNSNNMVGSQNSEDRVDVKIEGVGQQGDSILVTLKNFLPVEFYSLLPYDNMHSDFFLYLLTTAISVILFLFGYLAMDKSKRVGPLIARINKLEQQLLITMKENEMLQASAVPFHFHDTNQGDNVSGEQIEQLTQKLAEMQITKTTLEEQIQALEKELDTSTEVGMELNKIVSDMLNSSNSGSDVIKESIEQMKRELLEQQDTINSVNQTLSFTETENHELRLDLDISNKKVSDLQLELDKMAEKVLKIEEEKDHQQHTLEQEIVMYQQKFNEANSQTCLLQNEIQVLRAQLTEALREADVKVKEFNELKNSLKDIKSIKNNSEAMKSLLEVSSIKAELHQLTVDSNTYKEQLRLEQEAHLALGKKYQSLIDDASVLRQKYDFADKEKLEVMTKLDVLNNYFKEKERQMQKEISKYESLWAAKEGEATSTTERIKYMQDELQNYKSQNETLKQEIMNQEVELKSQISVLEKKVHENWVTNRQLERKLEEAKQEAAQLRNRLTLSERAVTEGNAHMRILPPMQNGELPLSPPPIDSPASPSLLYGGRDHITKSPPIAGLPPPPPFLPPPLGGPFMPPHLPGMPPFMPPPPSMFPGDHRPPPLGRMSSPPPMMMRYSPESTAYSGYDRNSPSPPYDSEYGASPPPMRSYSPYEREDRREYKRSHNRSNGRNNKGSNHLNSGSGRSNDSLDELYLKSSKKV